MKSWINNICTKKPIPFKVNFWQKISLIIFGLFLFVLFLEIGLRTAGFILLSLQEYRNIAAIKQKSKYVIMCLGESTTQGQYPGFLQEILNQRNPGIGFSVIDKGLISANTGIILSQLETNLDTYKPDIVVAMMGINDLELSGTAVASENSFFLRSSKVYRLLSLLWLHILTKSREIEFHKSSNGQLVRKPRFKNDSEYINLAWGYKAQGRFSEAEQAFKKAIELNFKNDRAYVGLGWVYEVQSRIPEAEQAFKKALRINPKNYWVYMGLGAVYKGQFMFPEAENSFKKAIELDPENITAYVELGWAYKYSRRNADAEQFFKKVLELNPKNDSAYVGLGWIHMDQGRLSDAEQTLKKAIRLNPKNDLAYVVLGGVYRDERRFSDAQQVFKKALEISPNNGRVYGALETVYFLQNGDNQPFKEYNKEEKQPRQRKYNDMTINNYLKLKQILDKRNVRLVCVQYPMCGIEPLKKIFEGQEGIIFVDNEKIFRKAVSNYGYKNYFKDMFAIEFGHCTDKGNKLLAENIADVILKEYFNW